MFIVIMSDQGNEPCLQCNGGQHSFQAVSRPEVFLSPNVLKHATIENLRCNWINPKQYEIHRPIYL